MTLPLHAHAVNVYTPALRIKRSDDTGAVAAKPADDPTPGPSNDIPSVNDDRALAGLYGKALSDAANQAPLFTQANLGIGPIPANSTFGRWRQHVDDLVGSEDFKRWAIDNRIDLSKPIRIYPPNGNRAGFIKCTVLPSPFDGFGPSASTRTAPRAQLFGADYSNSHALPLSWPLIMDAAHTLASGRSAVSAQPGAQPERPASLEELAAFYGETVPDTQDALNQRAEELSQNPTFALQGAHLEAQPPGARSEETLQDQARQLGDIHTTRVFVHTLTERLQTRLTTPEDHGTQPILLPRLPSPEQRAEKEKAWVATMLEETHMPVDPASWYSHDESLEPGEQVSLMRFIVDHGWAVPQTVEEVTNLLKAVQRAPLQPVPYGNFSGALGWEAPLSDLEKRQLYSHVRYNNLRLPGLESQTPLEQEHGALGYLTQNRHWPASALNNPRRVIQEILESPKAQALETALQQKMGTAPSEGSRDLVLGAIIAGLDVNLTLGKNPRNHVAGFNLADERFHGKPLAEIKQALIERLIATHRCSREMAPVAAHLLLSQVAPELLVQGLPADVTYGSLAWFSLKATVGHIEATQPGASASMTFAQVIEYDAIEPVTEREKALRSEATRQALIDWGLAQGVLVPSDTYSADQITAAQTALAEVMSDLQEAVAALKASAPTQKEVALQALGERLKNVALEQPSITNPSARTHNALSDELSVNEGPYSVLDIYLSEHAVSSKELTQWYSLDGKNVPSDVTDAIQQLPVPQQLHEAAFSRYKTGIEKGFASLTRHLISQLPLEDRKNLEYGQLEIFEEGAVSKHVIESPQGTHTSSDLRPQQHNGKRSLLIKTVRDGQTTFYEVSPQQNFIRKRDDLSSDFKTGVQSEWVKQPSGWGVRDDFTATAITQAQVPQDLDEAQLQASPPTTQAAPASYTSPRSRFLGELLSRHTTKAYDFEQIKAATKHTTRFEEEDAQREATKEAVLGAIPLVPLIRNVIKGNWLGVAGDLIFDTVMYATTAGFGRGAKAAPGVVKAASKPFGKRLLGPALTSSPDTLDGLRTLRRGNAAKFDPSRTSRRPDIAHGAYKKGKDELTATARLDEKTGQWFAFDPAKNKAYGKALDGFTPASGHASFDTGLKRDNVIRMGGTMKELKLIDNEIHTYVDVYKGVERINVVAHGAPRSFTDKVLGNGTQLVINNQGYSPSDLLNLLKSKGVDLSKYNNVRLLVCHSGEGRGSKSFAAQLQKKIQRPVKAFEGPVFLTHGSTSVTDARNDLIAHINRRFPGTPREVAEQSAEVLMQNAYVGKMTTKVVKPNGKKIIVDIEGVPTRVTYDPVKFPR